jgi:hypothetical protein
MEQTRVSDISYLGQDLFRCCPAYCCGSLEQRSWACWGSERDRHGPGTCQPSQVVRARRAAGVGLPTRAGMTKQNFGAWKQRVCRIVLIKTYAHRNLDNELCRLLSSRGARGAHDEGAWVRVGWRWSTYSFWSLAAAAGSQSMRVGHYRSLESCEAAANEAKGIGLKRGSFGFVCVRSFGPSDLVSAR